MNLDSILKISPDPSLPVQGQEKDAKEGEKQSFPLYKRGRNISSLWPFFSCRGQAREVGRDFIKMLSDC
jgi:hypothetical protein